MSSFMDQKIAEFESHDGGLLIDLRDGKDFDAGHIPGALHMTPENIRDEIRRLATFSTRILLYCYTGGRARQAAEMLKAKGYENTVDLGGIGQYTGRMEPAITVRELRRMKDLSQSRLAKAIGVRQPTVAAYECGKANPGPAVEARIRKLYHVTVAPMMKDPKYAPKAAGAGKAGTGKPVRSCPADASSATTIRELRIALGLSQAAIAKELGIKPGTVSAYEAGRIHPSDSIIRKAKDLYGASLTPGPSRRDRRSKKPAEASIPMFIEIPGFPGYTTAEILEKVYREAGEVDAIYLRTDQGKAYWVRNETETGSVDL